MGADTGHARVFCRAAAALPDHFLGVQVNGSYQCKRRSNTRSAHGRQKGFQVCRVRHAFLRHSTAHRGSGRTIGSLESTFVGFLTVNQLEQHGHAVPVAHHDLAFRVKRDTAPVRSAQRAWEEEHGVFASGCHRTFPAGLLELDTAPHLVQHGHAPHVLFAHTIGFVGVQTGKSWHARGMRLGLGQTGRVFNTTLGHRQFLHIKHGLAGAAIQHKVLATLGGLHQHGHGFALDLQVQQAGLRSHVVIPHVVVRGLEVPHQMAVVGIDGQHRAAELVVQFGAVARIVVRRGVAGGDVNHAQLVVSADGRPRVGRATGVVLALGRLAVEVWLAHVKRPGEGTGLGIKRADHARRLARHLTVGHPAAHHHLATHDLGHGADVVIAGDDVAHALLQINLPIHTKVGTRLAGLGIHCQQAGIHRGAINAFLAHAIGLRLRQLRIGHTTAGGRTRHAAQIDLGVEAPALFTRFSIQRHDVVARCAEVQAVANLQRGGFKTALGAFAGRIVAGAISPGHFQALDVLGCQLLQR